MELENILLSSRRLWNTNAICSLSCVDPSFYFAFVWVCMGAHVYTIDPRCHYSDTVVLAFWDCFHWPGASPSRVGLLSHKTQRGTCPFLLSNPRITTTPPALGCFISVLGVKARTSCLCSKRFISRASSLGPAWKSVKYVLTYVWMSSWEGKRDMEEGGWEG